MLAKLYSASILGIDAYIVEVEVDIQQGLEKFNIVGLPDKAVQESKERVISAIKNSTAEFVHRRITVNLAPANIQKSGAGYDLPIALGILHSSGQLELNISNSLFVGELALEGYVRRVDGIIVIADAARKAGFSNIFIPNANMPECSSVRGINVYGINSLNDIINHKYSKTSDLPADHNTSPLLYLHDFSNIYGQAVAKRVLEIAACGNHNVLLSGTPGSGKSLMAKAYPSILPPLNYEEQIEVTRIYSVAGKLPKDTPLLSQRPFRNPHHTASEVSLVGGGKNPIPGEVTLAHRGVLFLDEFSEFSNRTKEALRQPIEDGYVNISRASGTLSFPAKFQLVAAMNPCRCGWRGDPEHECTCSVLDIAKYSSKISGPILDRFDIQIFVPRVKTTELSQNYENIENSNHIRQRVLETRLWAEEFSCETRDRKTLNQMLSVGAKNLLVSAVDGLKLSARGYFRILSVGRTIANMERSIVITEDHIAEALSYRMSSVK